MMYSCIAQPRCSFTVDICSIFKGEFKITVSNWKDEGFRSLTNPSLDWKEQINYRIIQIIEGKEVILYYGCKKYLMFKFQNCTTRMQ